MRDREEGEEVEEELEEKEERGKERRREGNQALKLFFFGGRVLPRTRTCEVLHGNEQNFDCSIYLPVLKTTINQ